MKQKLLTLIAFLLSFGITTGQTFQDQLGNETDGDFPSKWDLIKGSA